MPDFRTLVTRREFSLALAGAVLSSRAAGSLPDFALSLGAAVVRKVYIGIPKPTWPRPDLDFRAEMAMIDDELGKLERKHRGLVKFIGEEWLQKPEDVAAWAAKLGTEDAVLVLDLTSSTAPILEAMRLINTPMLLFTRPYAGWSYLNFTEWRQSGKKADLVASSEFGDLDPYMRIFYAMHHVRNSKVLMVRADSGREHDESPFTKRLGTEIRYVTYRDVQAAYDAAGVRQAEKLAADFAAAAERVVEPKPAEIRDAMRLYLGITDLMAREKANAITIDCLGGFKRGELPAYPCVAWTKLNDSGFYGVCEADLPSTMTQILVTPYSNRPGFVSDPVFDTSRNEVLHAHCVSATALRGIGTAGCGYSIRSHMEDNKGVSIQVQVPIGETVTVGKFVDPANFVISTGEVLGNVESPRGCRTQFRTRVANARKMLEGYTGGLHRVVFYGDYVEAVDRMGHLMGFKVVRET